MKPNTEMLLNGRSVFQCTLCLTTIKVTIFTLVNITGRGQLNRRPQTTETWGKCPLLGFDEWLLPALISSH